MRWAEQYVWLKKKIPLLFLLLTFSLIFSCLLKYLFTLSILLFLQCNMAIVITKLVWIFFQILSIIFIKYISVKWTKGMFKIFWFFYFYNSNQSNHENFEFFNRDTYVLYGSIVIYLKIEILYVCLYISEEFRMYHILLTKLYSTSKFNLRYLIINKVGENVKFQVLLICFC